MISIVRFLAWVTVVLAVGTQATGLGTLGFKMCVERSGGVCAIEAPGQQCCAEDVGESADNRVSADPCDRCVDLALTLPHALAVSSTNASDHPLVIAVLPTVVEWMPPASRAPLSSATAKYRIRGPPPTFPDSLLIAETIVLRI